MNKEVVPIKQALELKELGFDKPCFGVYYTKDGDVRIVENGEDGDAQTFSQAFGWFREKHNINVVIDRVTNDEWTYTGYNFNVPQLKEISEEGLWNTYEEAELACLKKLIELVKNK